MITVIALCLCINYVARLKTSRELCLALRSGNNKTVLKNGQSGDFRL